MVNFVKTLLHYSMGNYIKIEIGDKFGRLEIIELPFKKYENVAKYCKGRYHASCKCICGNTKDVMLSDLVSGGTKSCGCYRSELKRKGSFAENGFKKCANCKKIKKVEGFSFNNNCKDKLSSRCRLCDKDKSLYNKYGITMHEYNCLLEKQNNGCAICGKNKTPKRSLAVDHCHRTNQIRGLLCGPCNTLLGKLGDSKINVKTTCEKFINYLDKYSCSSEYNEESTKNFS